MNSRLLLSKFSRMKLFQKNFISALNQSSFVKASKVAKPEVNHPKPLETCLPAPRTHPHFLKRHSENMSLAQNQNFDHNRTRIVFLGASLIEMWTSVGGDLWRGYFQPKGSVNLGIYGDRTQTVLWRIGQGELDPYKSSKLVVLNVGSNNRSNTPQDTAQGILTVVNAIQLKLPQASILLTSIFPRAEANHQVKEVNQILENCSAETTGSEVFYLNLNPLYETASGKLRTELYGKDKLHINFRGYEVWFEEMKPFIEKLILD